MPTSSQKRALPGGGDDRGSGLHPGSVHGSSRYRKIFGRSRGRARHPNGRRRWFRRKTGSFSATFCRARGLGSSPTCTNGLLAQESVISTTKRHPSSIRLRAGATRDGKLTAMDFAADFNTGAYSSWGRTVPARVPVHASGPYYVPHYRARVWAVHTHLVPAGAFRGFGVPQTAIAQEQLYDHLATGSRLSTGFPYHERAG